MDIQTAQNAALAAIARLADAGHRLANEHAYALDQLRQECEALRKQNQALRGRVAELEHRCDEVGIQLAAAQERIKLLEEGATLLRHIDEFKGEQKWGANGANHYHVPCDVIDIGVGCFLSALDAVPGDACEHTAEALAMPVDTDAP